MGLFGFGKKKDLQPIELKTLLSAEEIALLVEELNTTAARVPGKKQLPKKEPSFMVRMHFLAEVYKLISARLCHELYTY